MQKMSLELIAEASTCQLKRWSTRNDLFFTAETTDTTVKLGQTLERKKMQPWGWCSPMTWSKTW